jgi:hypothetical protein
MTTFIPALTLPRFVFEQPAVAILLPVVCGAGIGYATRRMFFFGAYIGFVLITNSTDSRPNEGDIWKAEAASTQSSSLGIWASMDDFVCCNGIYCI